MKKKIHKGVVEGGNHHEEGNLLGYGRSREYGGSRAVRRSAGGAGSGMGAECAEQRGPSAAIHGNSGRTRGTGCCADQPAGTRGASERKCAASPAASAGKGGRSAPIHAISGRTGGTGGGADQPGASTAGFAGGSAGEKAGSDVEDGTHRAG